MLGEAAFATSKRRSLSSVLSTSFALAGEGISVTEAPRYRESNHHDWTTCASRIVVVSSTLGQPELHAEVHGHDQLTSFKLESTMNMLYIDTVASLGSRRSAPQDHFAIHLHTRSL